MTCLLVRYGASVSADTRIRAFSCSTHRTGPVPLFSMDSDLSAPSMVSYDSPCQRDCLFVDTGILTPVWAMLHSNWFLRGSSGSHCFVPYMKIPGIRLCLWSADPRGGKPEAVTAEPTFLGTGIKKVSQRLTRNHKQASFS